MAEQQRQQLHDAFHRSPIVVGCALLPKKVQRYLTQRMLQTAAEHNILLKQIDPSQPLGPQGPFNVIIHKLRPNPEWEQQLRQYVSDHPQVVVVDRLDKIRQLHNRATMLRPLQGDGITLQQPLQLATVGQATISPPAGGSAPQPAEQQQRQVVLVQAPLQVEIAEGTTEAEAQAALAAAGLVPPLLCKPLWTDGRDGSHKLAVLHDLEALGRLLRGAVCHEFKPPLVVQQFVEHGGVLFKVYVLGSQTYVTARPSLGETVLEPANAVQQLPRISCVSVFSKQQQHQQHMRHHTQPTQLPAEQQDRQAGGGIAGTMQLTPPPPAAAAAAAAQQSQQQQQRAPQGHSAALAAVAAQSVWSPPSSIVAPPAWLTSALAATLRQELGMQLFNFDLIVPEQQPEQGQQQQQQHEDPNAAPPLCYVVDINFFPGVDKIPDFEQRFVDFLLAAATSAPEAADCGSDQQQEQEAKAGAAGSPGASAEQAAAAGKAAADGTGELQDSSARFRRQSSSSSGGESSGSDSAGGRGSSSSGGSGGISTNSSGSLGRCLQHSLSGAFSAGAAAGGGQHSRRHRASSGSGSGGHSSGRDSPAVSPAQWGDRGVLGSSPPPQLQVAGCS